MGLGGLSATIAGVYTRQQWLAGSSDTVGKNLKSVNVKTALII